MSTALIAVLFKSDGINGISQNLTNSPKYVIIDIIKEGCSVEGIVVLAVIVVLALILGVKTVMLLAAATALVGLFLLFMVVFFFISFFGMLSAKRTEAEFTRIGKRSPEARFNLAFYKIGDQEYPNIFPEEGIMEKMLYKTDRKYYVRVHRKGYVFDRFAVMTCTVGFIVSILIVSAAVFAAVNFL